MKIASHSLSRSKSVVAAYFPPATAARMRSPLDGDAREGEGVVRLTGVAEEEPRRLARHVEAAVARIDAGAVLQQVAGGLLRDVLGLAESDGEVVAASARQLTHHLDGV